MRWQSDNLVRPVLKKNLNNSLGKLLQEFHNDHTTGFYTIKNNTTETPLFLYFNFTSIKTLTINRKRLNKSPLVIF